MSKSVVKSKSSVYTGWLIALLYFLQSCLTIALPRTDKTLPMREELRNWHMLLGIILLGLLLYRLWLWRCEDRHQSAPIGLRPALFRWSNTLALTTWLLLLTAPLFGFLFAWSDGVKVQLGPLFSLPPLLGESYRLWMFSGYFHSGVGFMMLVLAAAALITAAYGWLRYRKGLFSLFPAGFGAEVLLTMTTSVWALSTFKSNAPGPRAVLSFYALVGGVWLLGLMLDKLLKHRNAVATENNIGSSRPSLAWIGAIALVGFGAYGPYATFRVSPWPIGSVIAGPAGITSHKEPIMRVHAWPSTKFERDIANETYKWCGFCHTYTKNGETKAGPNLYAIFGQRAASVPNFHYSSALAAKRDAGLMWTDAQLDRYLANPDSFVPGTSMIISSGPVSDPHVRRAVINMLKRDTMVEAIDMIPPPAGQ